MQISEEEHIAEMKEHQEFVLKAKAKVEQLEYEIEQKDKRLKEQYHEIVYLNNKIKDMESEQIAEMQEHCEFVEKAKKIRKEICNEILHELEPLATLTFNDYKLLEQTVVYWQDIQEVIDKVKGETK